MSSSTRASTMTDTRVQHLETRRWQHWRDLWRRFRRHRAAMTGFLVLGTMLSLVLTASVWTRHDPTRQQLSQVLQPMSAQHLLGTDHLGRDMGARLLYGGRLSLLMAVWPWASASSSACRWGPSQASRVVSQTC